jgi:hypothetical protein
VRRPIGNAVLDARWQAGVDGTFICTPSHDQRPRSLSTALLRSWLRSLSARNRSPGGARSEVRTNDLDGRRTVELLGDGHRGHGMWLITDLRTRLIRRYGRFLTAGSLRLWPRIIRLGSVRPLRAVGSVFGWRNRRDGHGDPAGFVPHSGPAIDASDPWLCVRGGEAWRRGSHRAVRGDGGVGRPGAQVDQAGTGLVPRRRPPAGSWCLASMRLPLYLAMN